MDYVMEDGRSAYLELSIGVLRYGEFSFPVHFMAILNPIYLFSCALSFLVELKACEWRFCSQRQPSVVFDEGKQSNRTNSHSVDFGV